MGLTVTKASAFDLLETLDDAGGARPRIRRTHFGRHARQVTAGPTLSVRDADGVMCLVAGLYPDDDGFEAWFCAGPGLRPHLKGSLQLARAALSHLGSAAAPLEVRALVHPDSVAGSRLAAWFGFVRGGPSRHPLPGFQPWVRRFEA